MISSATRLMNLIFSPRMDIVDVTQKAGSLRTPDEGCIISRARVSDTTLPVTGCENLELPE